MTNVMRRFQISLSEAKERLRIPAIWHHLALHGDPPARGIGACASPFRPDRHPSFSLYDEGRRWKDHSTGEGGDAIDFVKRATGLDQRAATLRFLELVGLPAPPKVTYSKVETNAPSEPGNPNISRLGTPTQDEIRQIAQLRHLEPEALNGLAQHGILRTGRRFGFHVWALVDGPLGEAPRVAEVRRLPPRDNNYRCGDALSRRVL